MAQTSSFLDAIEDRVVRSKFKQIDARLSVIERPVQSGDIIINDKSPLSNHAVRHASKRAAIPNSGQDPIDPYEFDWKQKHLFQMTEDETAVTINTPTVDSNADSFVVNNKDSSPSVEVGVNGAVAFSDAERRARVNIAPQAISSSGEPDEIPGLDPWIWFRPEDYAPFAQWTVDLIVKGKSDNQHRLRPEAPPSDCTVVDSVVNGFNAFAAATDGQNASISDGGDTVALGLEFTGAWTIFFVTSTVAAADPTDPIPIMGKQGSSLESGVRAAATAASANYFVRMVEDPGGADTQISEPVSINHSTAGQHLRVGIMRRDGAGNHWVYATNGSGNGQELTLGVGGNSGTQFKNNTETIVFDGILENSNDSVASEDAYLVEVAVYKGDIGQSAVLDLTTTRLLATV